MEELALRRYLKAAKAWSRAKNPEFKAYWWDVMNKLWGKDPVMEDPHTKLALELYGDDSPESREKAKIINFARLYSTGEIKLGQLAGQYPVRWGNE